MNAMKSVMCLGVATSVFACEVNIRTRGVQSPSRGATPGANGAAGGGGAAPSQTASTNEQAVVAPAAATTTATPATATTTAATPAPVATTTTPGGAVAGSPISGGIAGGTSVGPMEVMRPAPGTAAGMNHGATYTGNTAPLKEAHPSNPTGLNFSTPFGGPNSSSGAWTGDVYYPAMATTKLQGAAIGKGVVRLYTNELNIAPQAFTGFVNYGSRKDNFVIIYNGKVTVQEEADYEVRVVSADGSRLYWDEMLVVDNDGQHEAASKSQLVHLVKAVHTIRLEYFHNRAAKIALQLYIRSKNSRSEYLLTPGAWIDAGSPAAAMPVKK